MVESWKTISKISCNLCKFLAKVNSYEFSGYSYFDNYIYEKKQSAMTPYSLEEILA